MINRESVLKELQRIASVCGDEHMELYVRGARGLAVNLIYGLADVPTMEEADRLADETIERGLAEWRDSKAAKAASQPDVTC